MDLQISTNELFQLEIQNLELCKPGLRVKLQSTENRLKHRRTGRSLYLTVRSLDGPRTYESVEKRRDI